MAPFAQFTRGYPSQTAEAEYGLCVFFLNHALPGVSFFTLSHTFQTASNLLIESGFISLIGLDD